MPPAKDVTDEYAPLYKSIGEKSKELFGLAEEANGVIQELVVQEEVTHDQIESIYRQRYSSELYRLKNAPIKVDVPQIDLNDFYRKLDEMDEAKMGKNKHDQELMQQIDEKREQISAIEDALRKKLEIINSAKRLF